MIWQNAVYLWLIGVVVIMGLGMWLLNHTYKKRIATFFSSDVLLSVVPSKWLHIKIIRQSMFIMGSVLLIIALSGPKIGTEIKEVSRQGVDIMIALDMSASMNALDVSPSRLEKAKYEITRLVEKLKGDRVGLIAFTGEAFLHSPLTLDYSALFLFLNTLETSQMPSTTTNFESAMEMALSAFEIDEDKKTKASKILLIISDGEDQGNNYNEMLNELIDQNIYVFTIGIGTSQGEKIPILNPKNRRLMGYKRDNTGRVVITKLENMTLETIAQKGKGKYFEINNTYSGTEALYSTIDKLQKGEFSSQEFTDYANQYQWILAIALLCFLGSMVMPNKIKS